MLPMRGDSLFLNYALGAGFVAEPATAALLALGLLVPALAGARAAAATEAEVDSTVGPECAARSTARQQPW